MRVKTSSRVQGPAAPMIAPAPGRPLVVLLVLLLSCASSLAADWRTVTWVDDGDTVHLSDRRSVRYIGINAPEIAHGDAGRPAQPFGEAAHEYNRQLVLGKRVRLESDVEETDRYGRLLAYVFLEDGRMVNQMMVTAGLAYVFAHEPNLRYDRELIAAQREAMSNRRGLWAEISDTGEEVIGNRRSRRFHHRRCPSAAKIHPNNRFVLKNAWEAFWLGYAPAGGCLGR